MPRCSSPFSRRHDVVTVQPTRRRRLCLRWSPAQLQAIVAEVFEIAVRAARFVAGHAAQTAVDGLPFEAVVVGIADFGDDRPASERRRASSLLEAVDRIENRVPAAWAAVGDPCLQRVTVIAGPWIVLLWFALCKAGPTNRL